MVHSACITAHVVADERGEDADPHEDVERGEELPERGVRREVAVSDGRQRHDAEVVGVDPGQVLHVVIDGGADRERDDDDDEQDPKDVSIETAALLRSEPISRVAALLPSEPISREMGSEGRS